MTFSPNGTVLASSGYDGMLRLWKVTTGKASPLEALAAGASRRGPLRVWLMVAVLLGGAAMILTARRRRSRLTPGDALSRRILRSDALEQRTDSI